jgi:replicative DNA helicase
MSGTTDIAYKFFSAVVQEADPKSVIKYRNAAQVFIHVPSEHQAWENLYGYMTEHNGVPTKKTYTKLVKAELHGEVDAASYYYKLLKKRHIRKSLVVSGREINTLLSEGKEFQAMSLVEEVVKNAKMSSDLPIFNYKESHDLLKQGLYNKKQPEFGIQTGWKTLDEMTGGLRGGDMVSIVGRPGQGKSFAALAVGLHAWKKQKKQVLFISMEMNPDLVMERIAAMDQHIPYNWVKNGQFSTLKGNREEKFLNQLKDLSQSNLPDFNIVGGNFSANVEDIGELTHQLEPDLVIVDGAYLCKTKDNARKSNDRVSQVCEYLKMEVAENNEVPVIPVWQFNREATKLKKGQRVGLEHIADSDAIPRNSSLILGLMQEDKAATARERIVDIMKGRSGEQGRFNIKWDFMKMDFTEVEPIQDEDILIS